MTPAPSTAVVEEASPRKAEGPPRGRAFGDSLRSKAKTSATRNLTRMPVSAQRMATPGPGDSHVPCSPGPVAPTDPADRHDRGERMTPEPYYADDSPQAAAAAVSGVDSERESQSPTTSYPTRRAGR